MRSLKIFHPYGLVGHMPWQENVDVTPFGSNVNGGQLLDLSGEIKTFTEQIEDKGAISEMRKSVKNSDIIVFLGFHFHRQNVELLELDETSMTKNVYGTALGISNSDLEVVAIIVRKLVNNSTEIKIRNDLTCENFFDEFWRSLTV
jgi:hypothetical protein